MEETLQAVFRDVFDDPDLTVTDTTTAKDVLDWDSLNHLRLIVALEGEFTVRFTTSEIGSLANVGDLKALLRRKLGQS